MDVGIFCAQSHVLIVAGKGGVGKTTMAAALARMASEAGQSVLIVELEGKSGITGAFGLEDDLGYEEIELLPDDVPGQGGVRARRITPDDALVEYLEDHGLRRVSKRLVSSGVVDVVSTAIPGIRDVLVLGKIKQLEREEVADLIVVDAPGHRSRHHLPHLGQRPAQRRSRRAVAHPGPGSGRAPGRPLPVPGDSGHAP
jgi:anion-transporting  ArsA/GET3 family ATPase